MSLLFKVRITDKQIKKIIKKLQTFILPVVLSKACNFLISVFYKDMFGR